MLSRTVFGGDRPAEAQRPQPFELAPPHRELLGDAVVALGVDVEFVVLRQKLDLYAVAGLAPGLVE